MIGVIGAGVMGRGVAQVIASHSYRVILVDNQLEVLDEARISIFNTLRAESLFGRGRGAASDVLSRISITDDLESVRQCSVVVENIPEDIGKKRLLYESLNSLLAPEAVLAVNSSTFPIFELAAFMKRPELVIGTHFMNPAHSKEFVEVIPSRVTSSTTIERVMSFLAGIGKRGIVVKDAPGFVSNRVLMLTINEAIRAVEEGCASPDDVDAIFVGCFGHSMGPLATADLIGLDTILLSLLSLMERLGDKKYQPADLLLNMVREGKLGRKSEQGFFNY
ncbi:3-hydroxyacyl-CoA dehydrogenase family protein [Massilia sp. Root335]|uniref:3-hydroxyacyl-CoA dehydrogenase family protein n=1 Tax=Massilia sp. Root335 TaxID=1736517 RepID=UPI001910A50F|nr:3-hydroxyacyl-CoA dehydrogenase family protein [Massilia sp. Root335]